MIVSFSVSNFRSFSTEETLSLVASKRLSGTHEEHTVQIPGTSETVLKTAVIYGANGAGKSNLFKALKYLRVLALRPRMKGTGTGREPFRFEDSPKKESTFDLQFIAGDKLYRFGVVLDDSKILAEWLILVDGGKDRQIYERSLDFEGKVKIEFPNNRSFSEKLKALFTVGGPQNQTFLATVNVTLEASELDDDFGTVLEWFKEGLSLVGPGTSYGPLSELLATDSKFKDFAGEFLKAASTGVDQLHVSKKEISEEELNALVPKSVLDHVLKDADEDEDGVALLELQEGVEVLIEKKEGNKFHRITVQSLHSDSSGKLFPFEFREESDGTRRLLNLIPALHQLHTKSGVYFIDEIDRSLHPMLVYDFLRFFLSSCPGERSQVIVTTHESNLLDLDLLRRDEIWFSEKDQNGATRMYSLSDFKVRTDLDIRKHYLQGRFGAIPFLGNIDTRLIECGKGE